MNRAPMVNNMGFGIIVQQLVGPAAIEGGDIASITVGPAVRVVPNESARLNCFGATAFHQYNELDLFSRAPGLLSRRQ